MTVILDNGSHIYSQDTALDYLSSIGLSNFDDCYSVFCLALGLDEDTVDKMRAGDYVDKEEVDNYELVADGYLQAYNNLCETVNNELDKFINGRKKTKVQFADWLKNIMEDALLQY